MSLVQLDVSDMPKVPMMDKWVHFVFHCVLASLLSISLYREWGVVVIRTVYVITLIFSILYGGAIELMQDQLTVSRHADGYDMLANTFGGVVGMAIMSILKLYAKPE
ncbi:MAG: VanZ family protein [Flavobacteriales bacterium]|nr:VanZ family protein [Flavobacteriales bacterium]